MKNMTLKKIANACHGKLVGGLEDVEVKSVVTDSRLVEKGGLFLAVKGERVDGHKFIPQVMQAGAVAVVCEEKPEDAAIPHILVENVLLALQDIAAFYRKGLDIPIIGITGSVGKTSTKEFVASVLEQKYKTLKTEGNFNNEIGVPLTLLKIREEHEVAVVEMGINHFGEMRRLGRMVRPNMMLFTNIGDSHIEFLGSRDGILKAKTEVFEEMDEHSVVILNGEDDKLNTIESVHDKKPIRYGMSSTSDVYASDILSKGLSGSQSVLHTIAGCIQVHVPLPGIHMVYNALAATAVGLQLGLSLEEIKLGIERISPTNGRSNIVWTRRNTIIDDCYNANPSSMYAALNLLMQAEGRKVAILGDMYELGENTAEMHASVGKYASDLAIDVVVCIGNFSYKIAEEVKKNSKIQVYYFEEKEEFMNRLFEIVKVDDSVLIKASHAMGFTQIVDCLQQVKEDSVS